MTEIRPKGRLDHHGLERGIVAALLWLVLPVAGTAQEASTGQRAYWVALESLTAPQIDSLSREFDLRGTFQELTLARSSAREVVDLQAAFPDARVLSEAFAGERLFVIALRPGESFPDSQFVRTLERTESRVLVAAGSDQRIDPCLLARMVEGRTGAPFHDGVAVVPSRRQSPPRDTGGPSYAAGPAWDARIQGWIDQVSSNNLLSTVTHLSSYQTRRSDTSTAIQAQNWIRDQFAALGLSVSLHSFDSGTDNVVADLPGQIEPLKVVIAGAHYDSINGSGTTAPGADDNASGTAALLEMARILSVSGAPLRYTVRFIAFASEEFGLIGSDAYSQKMVNDGVDVVGMLNTDMNSYRAAGDAADLDFVTSDTTGWLTDLLIDVHSLYVPNLPSKKSSLSGGTSDHRSFFLDGFPAVFYFEDVPSYSPFIHTASDTVGNSANDFVLARDIVKSILAGTAYMAQPYDLAIDHDALGDSSDSYNPYALTATITSLIGTNPVQASVYYDAGSGEQSSSMRRTGAPDQWIGQIPAQPSGTNVTYWLEATDDQGNVETVPTSGSLAFTVGLRDVFYSEGFEAGDGGWTHGGTEDDWQRGAPQGKSTDPPSAYAGGNVFGTDLGASGFNGLYRSNADNYLRSPSINASGRNDVHLRYARSLGIEDAIYDVAELLQNGTVYWSNPAGGGSDHFIDSGWVIHDVDLSATADHNPDVRIRFDLTSDGGLEFGGWNVDAVELYSLQTAPAPALSRDQAFVSLSQGGTVKFALDLGAAAASRSYAFFAGASGTQPGFDIGTIHLDLNFDAVTALFLQSGAAIPGFFGQTDAGGKAQMTLTLPGSLDPALIGTIVYFAAATLGPSDTASNTVELLLVE